MRICTIALLLISISHIGWSQSINPSKISIVRDSFGIPHIIAKTDAEVAYGLAWAQCEDQFITMQELMAACKGVYGEIIGKDGIVADFGIKYMGIAEFVHERYNEDVTGSFKKYLESYVEGVNKYAKTHPEEVMLAKLFPISPQDVLVGYILGNVEISHAGSDLRKILNGRIIKDLNSDVEKGSNAIAVSSKKTKDGKTYLAINSHQPLEGWYSWYEAHLISEEGLNIVGGTFAGGICIFHGANENLGWAHTVNHADFSDVFKLTMNKKNDAYFYDGQWIPLEKKKISSKLKILGGIKIPIKRVMYKSVYGPTFKTDKGFFAWRFMAGQTLKMAEQWLMMNKATNFDEFHDALNIRGIVSTNIVYADRDDNIYYISNGSLPDRNPKYDWSKVLPGNTSETLTTKYIPLDSLPQVLNPESGWVFNTNNSPFNSSDQQSNPKETELNKTMGYQSVGVENNRSRRFVELIESYDQLSYDDFKSIKYDNQYPSNMTMTNAKNLEAIMHLDPNRFPDLKDAIQLLSSWDRRTNLESEAAPLFISTLMTVDKQRRKMGPVERGDLLSERIIVESMRIAKDELIKNFGSIKVPLEDFQYLSRGDKSYPMAGGPDVLAAMYSQKQKDGTYHAFAGESYIEIVRFSEDGVEIESINTYGASEKPNAAHFDSQMKYFSTQRLKKMSLNKEEVIKNALNIYSPQ